MRLLTRFLIATTLCLFSLSTANAANHIKDGLGLFSEQAINGANRQIDQVFSKHGWMIAVETRDAAETIPNMPKEASKQDEFLTSWTTKNYVDNKLEGIYLVIFKNPNKFRFHIDTDQQRKMGVTQADINSWKNLLQENLRVNDYDAALLASVGGMSSKLSRPSTATKALPPPPGRPAEVAGQQPNQVGRKAPEQAPEAEGPSILMWVLIAVGVFIIFRIIRGVMSSMSNSGSSGPGGMPNQYGPGSGANMGGPGYGQGGYGAPGYGGRGGGMMSGMLGGLFGGMAGSWMYDKMSGGHQSHPDSGQGNYTSHDSSRADSSSLGDQSAAESDSTTYGGDWGSDSSSSDSGGGDYGGGDSGGGGDAGGDW